MRLAMADDRTAVGPAQPGSGSGVLEELRALLSRERAAIEGAHRAGASGTSVARRLSDLADRVVERLAASPEEQEGADGWAFVALGGYGRRELAPHSDVDLMVLHEPAAAVRAERRASAAFQTLWDLKLRLGHSVRTVEECLDLAARDLATTTSLLDARRVAGDEELVRRLEERLRGRVRRRGGRFVSLLVNEMHRGHARHGSSLYRLEPNVKKSGGGLRTLHFLRWIALVRQGAADPGVLHARGLITADEGRTVREAQEFFWRVRNDLHFAAGHCADTVSFDDQLRLARLFGYRDDGQRLGVERFMQRYYLHATDVHEIALRFASRSSGKRLGRRLLERARARSVDGIFRVGPEAVGVSAQGRERVLSDPERLLDLFRTCQLHGLSAEPDLQGEIRSALLVQDAAAFFVPAVSRAFLGILGRPGRIGDTLSLMHRLGALSRVVPEFAAVNRLVQFNRFHSYTVDEHTFEAIRHAEALAEAPAEGVSEGPQRPSTATGAGECRVSPAAFLPAAGSHLRRAYARIRRKDLLHLALLLHDLGKGRGGDHSAIGAGLAAAAARRLGCHEHDARLLVFLVREHLTMEQVALRRDLTDEKVLVRFARTVANPETLRMLFVLTYADLAGVGPGSWTRWKGELLTALYVRAMDELAGGHEVAAPAERIAAVRREVGERVAGLVPEAWLEAQWEAANERYLLGTPPETVAKHLLWLRELPADEVLVRAENDAATGNTVYTVIAHEGVTPGLFSKIAGVLAAEGLMILRAQIDTRRDGIAVDAFDVRDTFHAGEPPAERLAEVSDAVREVLRGRLSVEELFVRHRRYQPSGEGAVAAAATQVEVDNDSSDRFTVIDVFTRDRQGLLYVIAKALWDLGLSVHASKVATRLDQVLDVFYVTDLRGDRVTEPERIEVLRSTLIERIETYEPEA